MARFSYFFFFLLLIQQSLKAQITVNSERDKDNNVNFYANNPTLIPYTVILNFSQIQNLSTPGGANATAIANPGTTKVATLRPTLAGQGTSYQYSFSYAKGNIYAKTKIDPIYLVPVLEGIVVRAQNMGSLETFVKGEQAKESFVGVSFAFDQPTQIVAPRKGIVSEMKMDIKEGSSANLSFSAQENYIEIYHEDGTFTKLTVLKSGTEKVKVGQLVYPGEVLADSGGENYSSGPHVRMITSRSIKEINKFEYQPFPVSFISDKGKVEIRQPVSFVTAHPEDVIILEMNKRELKAYQERK